LVARLGSYDLVGTTVKHAAQLPEHLLADEKHTWINGDKAVLATTVAGDCVLGVSLALHADTPALTEAYGHFKTEASRLQPGYQPQTVNTENGQHRRVVAHAKSLASPVSADRGDPVFSARLSHDSCLLPTVSRFPDDPTVGLGDLPGCHPS
jgi:hypothetical protein